MNESVDVFANIFDGKTVCEDPSAECDKRIQEQIDLEINKMLDQVIQGVFADAITGMIHV